MQLAPMQTFEWTLILLTAAVALTGIARRIGVPYPSFLALGGTALAWVPHAPLFRLNPELTLALLVAPVLLDTAFDTSLRDLKRNWIPVTALVLIAVGLTIVSVAWVAHTLVPGLPWAAAVTLGAIVAPPDAAAATAVLRQLRLPHRLLVVLEGESLLNDATALLVYRIASASLIAGQPWTSSASSTFVLAIFGSVIAGYLFARLSLLVLERIREVTSSVVMQFAFTWGVWIASDRLGLSPIVTLVVDAITVARYSRTPARIRVPSYAVWDTVVYITNVLAFVLIGLQLRPIAADLAQAELLRYVRVAGLVLVVVIVIRMLWVLAYNGAARWKFRHFGAGHWPGARPASVAGGAIVGWCGMRGIVTLAAAYALPVDFPYRGLILLCAFCVVVGTLVVQGLTLKPLILWLGLADDGPVEREVREARARLAKIGLGVLDGETSPESESLRQELRELLESAAPQASPATNLDQLRARIVVEQRRVLLALRASGDIGDEAFHELEARLDLAELNAS